MRHLENTPLKIATAGSVDDGKSTLIGRLLLENQGLFADQYKAVEKASLRQGFDAVNLALVTDGLKAEREQGITIDVAYRYFSTENRRFIIADCPGHVKYTRNMVSGCADAESLVLVCDAVRGITEQTKRHLAIAKVFHVPSVLVCINKMDEVQYSQSRFETMRAEIAGFCADLKLDNVEFIPISALLGKNISEPSHELSWFKGEALLTQLEGRKSLAQKDLRVSVQLPRFASGKITGVSRFHFCFVESGTLWSGQRVRLAKQGAIVRIRAIYDSGEEIKSAGQGRSVVCVLDSDLDIPRGEVLISEQDPVCLQNKFRVQLCWFSERALTSGYSAVLRQGTDTHIVRVERLISELDLTNVQFKPASSQVLANGICEVELSSALPVFLDSGADSYLRKFILVDSNSKDTIGTGVFSEAPPSAP